MDSPELRYPLQEEELLRFASHLDRITLPQFDRPIQSCLQSFDSSRRVRGSGRDFRFIARSRSRDTPFTIQFQRTAGDDRIDYSLKMSDEPIANIYEGAMDEFDVIWGVGVSYKRKVTTILYETVNHTCDTAITHHRIATQSTWPLHRKRVTAITQVPIRRKDFAFPLLAAAYFADDDAAILSK